MSLRSLDGPTGCGATYRRGYCLPSETNLQRTQPQFEDGSVYRQNRPAYEGSNIINRCHPQQPPGPPPTSTAVFCVY